MTTEYYISIAIIIIVTIYLRKKHDKKDSSEMSSHVRYEQTRKLESDDSDLMIFF